MSDAPVCATLPVRLDRLPAPPRYDAWPVAVRHAMKLRGALVPCGPGFRGAGWPETPAVRLNALAEWLGSRCFACRLTAAWVWGAARHPGRPLTHAVRAGHRVSAPASPGVTYPQLRLRSGDVVRIGRFETTSPLRTALDLLRSADAFGAVEIVACRLLLPLIPGGAESLRSEVLQRRQPGRRIARERLPIIGLRP